MKKLIFLLLFGIIFSNKLQSQSFCETPAISEYEESILESVWLPDYSKYKFCVKIYIHVIRKSDGTGGQSYSNVLDAIGFLDSAYNPYDIYFKWNGSVNYIDNTTYYNSPSYIMSDDSYDHFDGIDIYLFDDSTNHPVTGNGWGTVKEVGSVKTKLLVTGTFNNGKTPLVRSHVLSHELGHLFFLYHTHHGTVPETGDPNQCPECADGSNSSICGDYVTDTSADPGISYHVDLITCEWLNSGFDSCTPSTEYDPDTNNIMSYTNPICMEYITPGQALRAKKALALLPQLQAVSTYTILGSNPCDSTGSPFLVIYPNPAKNSVNIDLSENPEGEYKYLIYNIQNEVVKSDTVSNQNILVDISLFRPGIYFVHAIHNNKKTIKHLLIN